MPSLKKNTILLLVSILILSILFETFQQYYYLIKFNLATEVNFIELLISQSYRWIIWSVLAFPLMAIIQQKNADQSVKNIIYRSSWIILAFVALNIFLIAVISMILSGNSFSVGAFLNDYMVFFLVQKGPFFTLGYISISLILFLQQENQALLIKVQQLSELKSENADLYQNLSEKNQQVEQILTVKTGNRYNAVAIQDINYIEANDYCVNINTDNSATDYAMRISLKALESKLPDNFIRIHRKYIVNMNRITSFSASERHVELQNHKKLAVSKSKLPQIRAHFTAKPSPLLQN